MAAKLLVPQLNELEVLMRTGQIVKARTAVQNLTMQSLDRSHLADYANVARRAGSIDVALTLLRPVVRAEYPLDKPASQKEIAVYAAALADIGAEAEAMDLLAPLRNESPEVLLYRSFAAIYRWDYASAKRDLRTLIKLENIDGYQRAIAQLNLAAAHRFFEEDDQASALLEEVADSANRNGWPLIDRNTLDLSIQLAIFNGHWATAETKIAKCEALCTRHALDSFFLRKWNAVLALQRDGAVESALAGIAEIRREALQRGEFETQRDLDYYQSLSARDPSLYLRVLYGTSHEAYRKRMKAKAKGWLTLPDTFEWDHGEPDSTREVPFSLDLVTGALEGLGREHVVLRLLRLLASDFYRPFKVGAVFAGLYRGEYFDPENSPERVRAVIRRTRAWLESAHVPLHAVTDKGEARLVSSGRVSIRVALQYSDLTSTERSAAVKSLKASWPYKEFSVAQAAVALGISPAGASELLREELRKQRIHKSGVGRATRYRFSK